MRGGVNFTLPWPSMSVLDTGDPDVTVPPGHGRRDVGVGALDSSVRPGAGAHRGLPAAVEETLTARVAGQLQVVTRGHAVRDCGDETGTGCTLR